jgi:hypothetical protein
MGKRTRKLSPREIECLLLLLKAQIDGGGPPTYAELGRQMGGITAETAHQYVQKLHWKESAAHHARVVEIETSLTQLLVYIGWNGSIDGAHPLVRKAGEALDRHLTVPWSHLAEVA